ncbi:MAG: SAM hydroxide adenosyltransferase, partial [Phycisphaerae bacterium]
GGAAGTVTRIDYYGNCITNVPAMWMDEAPIGTPLTILVDGKPHECTWQRTYGEVAAGKLLALSTASGWVEIAGNKASAATLLGLSVGNGVALRAKK